MARPAAGGAPQMTPAQLLMGLHSIVPSPRCVETAQGPRVAALAAAAHEVGGSCGWPIVLGSHASCTCIPRRLQKKTVWDAVCCLKAQSSLVLAHPAAGCRSGH